jgi:NADH-quinone oxidoreductase subunit N
MSAWFAMAPELGALSALLLFLGLTFAGSLPGRVTGHSFRAAAVLLALLCLAAAGGEGSFFAGTLRIDLYSQLFKALLALGVLLLALVSPEAAGIPPRVQAEAQVLLWSATLALMLLVSAVHLLTFYVALELSSYALYLLTALRTPDEGRQAPGAALQYFLTGICASALTLFGMALLYGQIPSADLAEIARRLPGLMGRPVVAIALLLLLCGLFFKLALFPFHIWAPDAYHGAANFTAAYIATVSKVAAIALLARFVHLGGQAGHDRLLPVLATLAVASMTVGNLAALAQTDFKRMLAWSSIAHAGYVLLAILCASPAGVSAALFYALAVLLMKFTCFMVLMLEAPGGGDLAIADLAGLHHRRPVLALALMMALFGLAGLPPSIGFTAKLLVFIAAVEKGLLPLVLAAMANVVISLYYYLMVVRAAYLLEAPGPEPPSAPLSLPLRWLAAGLVALMTAAGLWPAPLLALARAAAACLG